MVILMMLVMSTLYAKYHLINRINKKVKIPYLVMILFKNIINLKKMIVQIINYQIIKSITFCAQHPFSFKSIAPKENIDTIHGAGITCQV